MIREMLVAIPEENLSEIAVVVVDTTTALGEDAGEEVVEEEEEVAVAVVEVVEVEVEAEELAC